MGGAHSNIAKFRTVKKLSQLQFVELPLEEQCGGVSCTPYTATLTAILDHSGTPISDKNVSGWYGGEDNDKEVLAYTGEVGKREWGWDWDYERPGYMNRGKEPFSINGDYEGVKQWGSRYLNYDGHPGYDFKYGYYPLLAPASGYLFKASVDTINGKRGKNTAWEGYHTFFILHHNGYTTWYLHAESLLPEIEASIGQNFSKPFYVKRGEMVGTSGERGTGGPHLHFEVRSGLFEIVIHIDLAYGSDAL